MQIYVLEYTARVIMHRSIDIRGTRIFAHRPGSCTLQILFRRHRPDSTIAIL